MKIMTGEERAALLLKSLPSEMAEAVLARLGSERSAAVRARMQLLEEQPESAEALDEALSDLDTLLRIARDESVGPPAEARGPSASRQATAHEANGDELKKEDSGSESAGDALSALRQMDVDLLAAALKGENSRTVCLLLNDLDAIRAGEILKRLPAESRREVTLQLGQAMPCSAALLERIAQAIVHKSRACLL
jgi:flagellar motor switch protein FliG